MTGARVLDAWYTALAGVTSAVGAFIRDASDRVLLAQPTYKEDWVLVGGTVDGGESPTSALRREIAEELGLPVGSGPVVGRLLVTDWIPPQAGWNRPMHHLVFDCGIVEPPELAGSAVPRGELHGVEFVPVRRALRLLAPHEARRLEMAIAARETGQHFYLESGRRPDLRQYSHPVTKGAGR